jgi:hypothetical protein
VLPELGDGRLDWRELGHLVPLRIRDLPFELHDALVSPVVGHD